MTPSHWEQANAESLGATIGEGEPSASLAKGAIYFQANNKEEIIAVWVGAHPAAPIKVAEFTGIPAKNSVGLEQLTLALLNSLASSFPNNIVTPIINPGLLDGVHTLATANLAMFVRCIIPATGVLKDISIFVPLKKGSVIVGVYDTGQALAGSYTRLKVSGEVALAAEGEYQKILETPNMNVTKGQQVMLSIVYSSAEAKYPGFPAGGIATANASKLPPEFLGKTGVASAQLFGQRAVGAFSLPETLAENLLAPSTTATPLLIARVE